MSLFGSFMGDFEDDIFGNHMNAMNMQMRSMNRLMNSFMPDPFNMLTNFDGGFQQNALMERQHANNMGGGFFGFPAMPNMNRLLSADIGSNGTSFCSSSVISMSSGPDGRPQIYQASSSTKTGPGGIRETRRSVQDSVNGVKKMAIGHHIGERAHIIEKEQDLRSGQLEERQEFINLEEEQAEDFDREFTTKARGSRQMHGGRYAAIAAPPQQQQQQQQQLQHTLTIEPLDDDEDEDGDQLNLQAAKARRQMPSLPSAAHSASQNSSTTTPITTSAIVTSPSASPSSSASPSPSTSPLPSTSPQQQQQQQSYDNVNSAEDILGRRAYSHQRSSPFGGIAARRTLRTIHSSPLTTTPTVYYQTAATATPSVHPHPYHTSAARRNHHHRNKQHSKHHHTQAAAAAAAAASSSNSKTAASAVKKDALDK